MIICLGTTPTVQRTMTFATLAVDGVNRATAVRQYASGKSTNVARVLHALGNDVLTTGFLGGDLGKFYRGDLDAAGIAHDFVEVEPATRLCITVVDESAHTATELIEESRPVGRAAYGTLQKKLAAMINPKQIDRSALVVLSGTLPPDAPKSFYAHCVELAQPMSRVVLDAVGEPLLKALEWKPFVIKPNQAEVGRTLGMAVDTEGALRGGMKQLTEMGAPWVVVTRGRSGTLVTDGSSFWTISTPRVNVISAIGSGDAFAAGLSAGLARGEEVPQACALGVACGSANAMTADAGHLSTADVQQFVRQVRVERLSG
jgi:tagatose 6-phosphate kinase